MVGHFSIDPRVSIGSTLKDVPTRHDAAEGALAATRDIVNADGRTARVTLIKVETYQILIKVIGFTNNSQMKKRQREKEKESMIFNTCP